MLASYSGGSYVLCEKASETKHGGTSPQSSSAGTVTHWRPEFIVILIHSDGAVTSNGSSLNAVQPKCSARPILLCSGSLHVPSYIFAGKVDDTSKLTEDCKI
jgi:hypothetical protein